MDLHSNSMMVSAYSVSQLVEAGKPFLVYGTAWKKEDTARYVSEAVHAGFRFIDTACQPKHYNEAGVGNGWTAAAQELGLQRSDLFLQTKFTSYDGQDPNNVPYDHTAPIQEQIHQSLQASLKNLHTDYLDSLVMHSPLDTIEHTMEAWRVMEGFVDDGKVLRLGISNCYDYDEFTNIYNQARIKPSVLQNRFYAESNFDTQLRAFCKEHNIWYQSFWTLTASRNALALAEVKELAKAKNLTPQTYMYAFLMSLGYATPLSGTRNPQHMAQDVAIMERMQGGEIIFESEDELRHFAQILGMPDL
jgi:diketogulonate reductase-like aldo/keto reductase